MALAPERYRAIDTTLHEIQAYLREVAREIDEAAWYTNRLGHTYQMAVSAANQITQLRHALQQEQEHQHMGEERQRQGQQAPGAEQS